MANENAQQIAATIRAQLGGALAMLGAHSMSYGENGSLSLKIKGSKKANAIVIELNASDTYTVTFFKINRKTFDIKKHAVEGVYADSLHRVIESNTGLRTSL